MNGSHRWFPHPLVPLSILTVLLVQSGCGSVSSADQTLIQSTWRFLGVCALAVSAILALSLVGWTCLRKRNKS
jgi:hypothetical protein